MKIYRIARAASHLLLQLTAMLAMALVIILTTPRLEEAPTGNLTEMRDARSFPVV